MVGAGLWYACEAAGAARAARWVQQPFSLVDPQRLRVQPRQLCGHRDAEQAAVQVRAAPVRRVRRGRSWSGGPAAARRRPGRLCRLGASWDAARADARLRAHGIRRGVHGERKRPKAGRAALTDTEQTVAALLAEGRSNPDIAARMFISRRTVQFHVSDILAKLGLSSRVELAALVARRAG